ncbi:DUF2905 domain-containing protein [Bacillus sp. DJP31]|uniref:DUF2905 domain-containing protein n=1 Tax=Bacillus sp. DJP31 TaxID=3409789 RepID=UPI003BB5E75C
MELPKMLMILGALLFLVGIIWQFIGRIPGDFVFKKGNITFYFPIVTSIVISVLLSIVFYFLGRFR